MNILFLFAQVATEEAADAATEIAADAAQTQAQINIIDLAMKGGWIMGVLLVLSLVAIYFFIQRLLVIRQAGRNDETFMNRIRDYIYEGKIDQALNLCRTTPTPAARMIEKGILRLGRPTADVLAAIENAGNIEISKLERGFPVIGEVVKGAGAQLV